MTSTALPPTPCLPGAPARVAPLHDTGGPGVAALELVSRALAELDAATRAVALGQLAAVVHRFSSTGDDEVLDAALRHWWRGWVSDAQAPSAAPGA